MMDYINMAKKKAKAFLNGQMAQAIKELLNKTTSMEKDVIYGLMEKYIKDNGQIIKELV